MNKNTNYNEFINNLKLNIKTKTKQQKSNKIIFCCIGTDRVIGDCIGPITGSLLKNKIGEKNVYGNLEENLTFNNINKKIKEINLKFKNPLIIAIDSALSEEKNIGKIFVENDGIILGKGLNKTKIKIGNIGIKVVVGKDYNDNNLNFQTLQNIPLNKIIYLSKIICDGIIKSVK